MLFGKDQDAEGLKLPDDERREKGARHAAHAADHGDDEGLGDDRQVHARIGRDARDLERAAEAGEKGAEKQRAGEQHRLVDAERRHHVAILRRRPHQNAEAGPAQEKPDEAEHDGAGGDQHELVGRKAPSEDFHRRAQARRAGSENVLRPEDLDHEILHHQHDAEGGEQLEQLRRAVDAPQQQDLDDDADDADDERREQNAGPEGDGSEGEFEQPRHQGRGRVGADHVERTVREVHDPRDAEDDGQAAGGDEKR